MFILLFITIVMMVFLMGMWTGVVLFKSRLMRIVESQFDEAMNGCNLTEAYKIVAIRNYLNRNVGRV